LKQQSEGEGMALEMQRRSYWPTGMDYELATNAAKYGVKWPPILGPVD